MGIIPQTYRDQTTSQLAESRIVTGLPWKILLFSVFLFGFSILVFFGLRFGYKTYLSTRSENLDARLEELASRVSGEDEQDLIALYSQIVNLREVLKSHKFTVNTIELLEKYTLPSVYFYDARISGGNGTMDMRGKAKTMRDFVEQLSIFDAAPEFAEKTAVDRISFDANQAVDFTIILKASDDTLARF
ncbi:hypothetical protein A3D55_01780 [Candidatus Jorgensenbacteria bacterium RIFCSPHIGHO2_02_FULL_45_20]|uniref:PilN domain-containing protein n=2 Tax=Candidatus Joergenseniibacteriota TaxID=1752739 RepID=A0A1F6BPW9_9BACT|nr:MAG: hypothetical protein UX22_C0011G0005 [Candidatus Jorgensenbacteria bacterium GW2011_GWA2_45_9]OGG38577.1 MAG: hypothetical protein A3D55_01780 [Candidatus Jorgensenbacteria bacterium RIFCSPHIGHO2_02_FULL_45_20]